MIEPSTIEHLKMFAGLIIDQYHDGSAPDPAVAKMRLWEEMQRCLAPSVQELKLEGYPFWLRLSGESAQDIMEKLKAAVYAAGDNHGNVKVVSLRWLGSREGLGDGSTVAWAVLDVTDLNTAMLCYKILNEQGLSIRDGAFGGVTLG